MTKKLYWEDAYMKEFDARVVEMSEKGLVLDQTAFYSAGGGQLNDTGAIEIDGRGYKVVEVKTGFQDSMMLSFRKTLAGRYRSFWEVSDGV
ncbi:MAG: alanine--tRNA ligase-related protein [Candidatus Marsarchaeota archaeon]|nr:alanine--tRNA ligase-related protein [Candidatus Marsarchaeota archaeon]